MALHICLFEDEFHSRLFPLVYFRPVYNLRCGIFSLREKVQHAYPKAKLLLHCRPYLADVMRLRYPQFSVNWLPNESILFINGRAIVDKKFAKNIPLNGDDVVYCKGNTIVAARVSGETIKNIQKRLNNSLSLSDFAGIKMQEIDATVIDYPWDLIKHNGEQIRADFAVAKKTSNGVKMKKYNAVYLLNSKEIKIGEGAIIKPSVVIDAEDGPVYIGKNVTIMPFSVITGPAYIGNNTIIKAGAKIYHNTSIGPMCKVGGEVEDSIIHSYSNKQHDGFLGHSYLGSWVNLGAGTTTSDLKNNYSTVKVEINGKALDTGMQFVGLIMGDHSKTAINSAINTGTIAGVSSNIFGLGFPPKFIPSFAWGGAELFTTYSLNKALDVARKVMARRKINLSEAEEQLFKAIFDCTNEERRKFNIESEN